MNPPVRARLAGLGVGRDHARITSVGDGEITRWRMQRVIHIESICHRIALLDTFRRIRG